MAEIKPLGATRAKTLKGGSGSYWAKRKLLPEFAALAEGGKLRPKATGIGGDQQCRAECLLCLGIGKPVAGKRCGDSENACRKLAASGTWFCAHKRLYAEIFPALGNNVAL